MIRCFIVIAAVSIGSIAAAQQTSRASSAQIAGSSAGSVGERQTRSIVAEEAGIKPMARLNLRVQNRVQSRIRNRIDRYYDPQANALSPFKVAGDEARKANSSMRR